MTIIIWAAEMMSWTKLLLLCGSLAFDSTNKKLKFYDTNNTTIFIGHVKLVIYVQGDWMVR